MDLKNITGANKVPAKSTGTEINTGTNDTNFVTPKSLADQTVLLKSAAKASASDINTGTEDNKYVTPKGLADQTVLAKTASPTFTGTVTLPKTTKIKDTSADHTYDIAVSELTADRTVTLPLLTGNDEFMFKDFHKASSAEINTGTEDNKYATAKAIKDSGIVSTAQANEFSGLTEKTTLADNDLILIEDSAALYVKKKVKKSTLGGSPSTSSGTGSRSAGADSSTQTFAHGLGKIPSGVRITCHETTNPEYFAKAFYNGSVQSSLSKYYNNVGNVFRLGTGPSYYTEGVITFDSTKISIAWTKGDGTVNGYYLILWEAIA